MQKATSKRYFHRAWVAITMFNHPWIDPLAKIHQCNVWGNCTFVFFQSPSMRQFANISNCLVRESLPQSTLSKHHLYNKVTNHSKVVYKHQPLYPSECNSINLSLLYRPQPCFGLSLNLLLAWEFRSTLSQIDFLRYESSTLILYKELSSTIFQSCQSVCQASVTPVQISTLCNI